MLILHLFSLKTAADELLCRRSSCIHFMVVHHKDPFVTPGVERPLDKSNNNGFRRAGDELRSIRSLLAQERMLLHQRLRRSETRGRRLEQSIGSLWPISSREGDSHRGLRMKEVEDDAAAMYNNL